ncbi:isoprenylcysteine carboxyl methyltransferase family protein [Solibacillus daqui]|uniref:isoprenylcysteine carboxyl methyltransferase family protein n=1 Tax=Solibacillus daqui TaxID=2912187 RepID=UPI0023652174|nr:isoprenylcysteine carboxylmethyltransferase family protein [Solibacillus daqui]
MIFYFIFVFVIIQRLVELLIAKRNEKLMRAKGAYEVGASHYPFMIALHVSFFISLLIEVLYFKSMVVPFYELLVVFVLLQLFRIWCLVSLGMYWNTKIIILPGANVVVKGPYSYIRHPNYLVVCLEILVLPLLFHAYVTALIFTILNFLMLAVRIPIEEKALKEVTDYATSMKRT